MHDLLVDADQDRPWECVDEGRRRPCTVGGEEVGRHAVQFTGCDPWPYVPLERLQGQPDDTTDRSESASDLIDMRFLCSR